MFENVNLKEVAVEINLLLVQKLVIAYREYALKCLEERGKKRFYTVDLLIYLVPCKHHFINTGIKAATSPYSASSRECARRLGVYCINWD